MRIWVRRKSGRIPLALAKTVCVSGADAHCLVARIYDKSKFHLLEMHGLGRSQRALLSSACHQLVGINCLGLAWMDHIEHAQRRACDESCQGSTARCLGEVTVVPLLFGDGKHRHRYRSSQCSLVSFADLEMRCRVERSM